MANGLGLIVAIGAQNAFVLRQGLLRRHVGAVVAFCAAADALLIAAGITGLGALLQAHPSALAWARWGGVVFLAAYAALAAQRAWHGEAMQLKQTPPQSLARALLTCAGFTFLNPHVYLDTVLLLGAIAQQSADRNAFGLGAMSGSVLWFSALGFGARWLTPLFAKPIAWRVLDALIALTLGALAGALAWS
jgi:L-lysine exporter family protein LysE/ArgO